MVFKHKIVNDLAWVIGSIPLMSYNPKVETYHYLTKEWFEEEYNRCQSFLLEQDKNPSKLEEFMYQEGRQLLGKRFEKFMEYWLRFSGRFELLLANVPLRQEKITVGEIDFLVKERSSGEIWHLEVASKYYLGYNDSALWENWLGLNATDALSDKMKKFDKQLSVFQREEGRGLLQRERIKSPKSYLLMKGFFFYYWKNMASAKSPKMCTDNHHTGLYLKEKEMSEFFSGNNSWVVLSKHNWFAPYTAAEGEEVYSELLIQGRVKALLAKYKFGVMLARLSLDNGMFIEDLRVAITLDSWPEKN